MDAATHNMCISAHYCASCCASRKNKQAKFSRRRRYNPDKDVDSINGPNDHFNRKIERTYGKYTQEIKVGCFVGLGLGRDLYETHAEDQGGRPLRLLHWSVSHWQSHARRLSQ